MLRIRKYWNLNGYLSHDCGNRRHIYAGIDRDSYTIMRNSLL